MPVVITRTAAVVLKHPVALSSTPCPDFRLIPKLRKMRIGSLARLMDMVLSNRREKESNQRLMFDAREELSLGLKH